MREQGHQDPDEWLEEHPDNEDDYGNLDHGNFDYEILDQRER